MEGSPTVGQRVELGVTGHERVRAAQPTAVTPHQADVVGSPECADAGDQFVMPGRIDPRTHEVRGGVEHPQTMCLVSVVPAARWASPHVIILQSVDWAINAMLLP